MMLDAGFPPFIEARKHSNVDSPVHKSKKQRPSVYISAEAMV